ncbi:MAG: hypothetical protein AAB511_03080 [Patescibacteria group bacterium]
MLGAWGSVFLLSGHEWVTIRDVEVEGAKTIVPTEITDLAEEFLIGRYLYTASRANILLYPKGAIENKILELFPQVERVSISFKNLHAITIRLTERTPEALWCQAESSTVTKSVTEHCFVLDADGFIFAPDSILGSSTTKYLKFYSAKSKGDPIRQEYASVEYFYALLDFAKDLADSDFPVSFFRERTDTDFEAKLLVGPRLIFGRDADFVSVLSNFRAIISDPNLGGAGDLSTVDYVDLRYGSKVFYKAY